MKKIVLLSFFSFVFLFPYSSFGQDNRTEDYAIISIFQKGKKNFMSVTIGSNSSEEKEFEKDKNEKRFDLSPVIKEMEKLNEQGYELFNSNVSMITASQYGGGLPFYYFLFKKKR